ncbi:MAG: nucleoside hydrolase [Acidobacteriota bacterium]|nr:nucleoside hydrolase [Acidobacteriota bacterium]
MMRCGRFAARTAGALVVAAWPLAAAAAGALEKESTAAALGEGPSAAARIKLIADQDSAGPHGTNFLSLLMLLNSPRIDLLGITTVSGDQWVEQATVFALHAVELAGRRDVPVVKGAEKPLLRTAREQELMEALYGSFANWHGSFNPGTPRPEHTWPPPGGYAEAAPRPGRAAEFLIETVRAHPGEVVLYLAGPLTNLALAVRMDPGIVPLVKSLYVMGASSGGGFELNWWWDPEAAAIVMREPWREIVVTTGEIGFSVTSSERLMRRVVAAGGPFVEHLRSLYLDFEPPPGLSQWSAMWDELAVAALLDPSVIIESETMWLDVDLTRGPKYGHTVVWRQPEEGAPSFFLPYSGPGGVDRAAWRGHLEPPSHLTPATVQLKADVDRFEDLFVEVMSRQ